MANDSEEFVELTKNYEKSDRSNGMTFTWPSSQMPESLPIKSEEVVPGQPSQYALYGPGYKPTTPTIDTLKPGCYDIRVNQEGTFVVPLAEPSGLLLELPQMRSDHVIGLVDNFWNSEKDYKEGNDFVIGGAIFKAGILLYGPPGSGKSCTIKIVSKKLVARDGTVFFGDTHPSNIIDFLDSFSKIEPNRKTIVILEDLDSLISRFGEDGYLQLLDSAKSANNTLFIATTNYPERLDPRIFNRPGRFSHVVKIGLPTAEARRAYLEAILKNHRDVDYIVENSASFTVDHLTALVNATYREKKNLKEELERLRTLFKIPKSEENTASIGFGK